MSEIPADIADQAREAIREETKIAFPKWGVPGLLYAVDAHVAETAIAHAILAERERIAAICRNWRDELAYGEYIERAMQQLADRIERGKP